MYYSKSNSAPFNHHECSLHIYSVFISCSIATQINATKSMTIHSAICVLLFISTQHCEYYGAYCTQATSQAS